MDTKEFLIVKRDDRYWIFLQKSPPDLENGDPLHAVLRWIIEQLHLGMYRTKSDEQGDRCTLVIGRAASHHLGSIKEAEKHARDSLLHLNISSLLAKAREEGSRPETVELVEQATVTRTAWA